MLSEDLRGIRESMLRAFNSNLDAMRFQQTAIQNIDAAIRDAEALERSAIPAGMMTHSKNLPDGVVDLAAFLRPQAISKGTGQ
ncbi:MAG: hypothetical protein WD407_08825 [Rhodospirillales bacterium]